LPKARAPEAFSSLSRGARHEVAFGLFGLFCTKQPLVLLLLEFRFGHRICSRIRRPIAKTGGTLRSVATAEKAVPSL
jgi:hypothetical protein